MDCNNNQQTFGLNILFIQIEVSQTYKVSIIKLFTYKVSYKHYDRSMLHNLR